MKATVVRPDGTITEVGTRKLSLSEMQEFVGGYIERVTIKGGELYVDEEGLLKGLPVNVLASGLAGRPLVGNALVLMRKVRGG